MATYLWCRISDNSGAARHTMYAMLLERSTAYGVCHASLKVYVRYYSQGRVKHDMRIAKKTRYKRVQNALISIAFLRFANALTNAPIKWLHKNAKIAFVRVFRFSQSELRFHFAFLRANAFAI